MNVKLIAAAVGGAVYGAAVAWAVTADKAEQREQEIRDGAKAVNDVLRQALWEHATELRQAHSENALIREKLEAYESVNPPMPDADQSFEAVGDASSENSPGEHVGETIPEGEDRNPKTPDDLEEFNEIEVEATRERLQGFIEQYSNLGNSSAPSELEQQAAFVNDKEPPFVISKAEYAYSESLPHEYDKITVRFYPADRLIIDEDEEEPLEDVGNTIGWANLRRFGDDSNDPDTVFVRNHRLQTDFEVVKYDEEPPIHIRYSLGKEEFRIAKAAGVLKLRPEDLD